MDAEPLPPYRNRAILRRVHPGTESIVWVAPIPLNGAYVDEARMEHAGTVFRIVCSHPIDMNVRAV
jgi:hypothetical protein